MGNIKKLVIHYVNIGNLEETNGDNYVEKYKIKYAINFNDEEIKEIFIPSRHKENIEILYI